MPGRPRVRYVLFVHLPGSGAGRLSLQGGRTSTLVECSQLPSHADGLLFVPEHRTQPSLSSSPSDATSWWSSARISHHMQHSGKPEITQTCLSLVGVVGMDAGLHDVFIHKVVHAAVPGH